MKHATDVIRGLASRHSDFWLIGNWIVVYDKNGLLLCFFSYVSSHDNMSDRSVSIISGHNAITYALVSEIFQNLLSLLHSHAGHVLMFYLLQGVMILLFLKDEISCSHHIWLFGGFYCDSWVWHRIESDDNDIGSSLFPLQTMRNLPERGWVVWNPEDDWGTNKEDVLSYKCPRNSKRRSIEWHRARQVWRTLSLHWRSTSAQSTSSAVPNLPRASCSIALASSSFFRLPGEFRNRIYLYAIPSEHFTIEWIGREASSRSLIFRHDKGRKPALPMNFVQRRRSFDIWHRPLSRHGQFNTLSHNGLYHVLPTCKSWRRRRWTHAGDEDYPEFEQGGHDRACTRRSCGYSAGNNIMESEMAAGAFKKHKSLYRGETCKNLEKGEKCRYGIHLRRWSPMWPLRTIHCLLPNIGRSCLDLLQWVLVTISKPQHLTIFFRLSTFPCSTVHPQGFTELSRILSSGKSQRHISIEEIRAVIGNALLTTGRQA